MKPLFHTQLVNGTRGDPALYIDFQFRRRALMFDLGDVSRLEPRRILRLSDVFVSHAHMDHFMGLDRLVRLMLGRGKHLRLYGPPGFIDRVRHRLHGYTWNLVRNYAEPFIVEALEQDADGGLRRSLFHAREAFRQEDRPAPSMPPGTLLDEEEFRVRAVPIDHHIPCLAFALEEKAHLNVWKNRLEDMGLPTGPWLNHLKHLVRRGAPDDTPVEIAWHDRAGEHRVVHALGRLRQEVLQEVRGRKLVYVVDAAFHEANRRRIVELAREADLFYVEAPFLNESAERASDTAHLTAAQAGLLAREAGVKRVIPFHFSARHTGDEARIRAQVMAAFRERPAG
ncbi:ribonuclease Z [Thioalkalivibrio denitrificans]|uniref:Ribonuclease Z n=1 Tax=Thioalkalivibrio denitrificans TaxID=108003 RepID=A0A1V3NMZ8_9GAMM|nr:MBL fold metallo-hydrolase [Thioalkalivibrio denitrificans]OOG26411.1 ribonuclease Z [Thioalkalivibrio denitrificans]